VEILAEAGFGTGNTSLPFFCPKKSADNKSRSKMLYVFFWVIPRLLNFIRQRFGTLSSIFIGKLFTYLPMKMEQTECSETSAYKIQTPGSYPEENMQHTEHGESLKSRIEAN
jgi:hypothetical protein